MPAGYDATAARWAYFLRNNDDKAPWEKVLVSTRTYRSMNALLQDLSHRVGSPFHRPQRSTLAVL